ncbi:MAG: prepilin-type N-terminal cleavage/methylation domain-containing protein [Gemmataceae bacterium]
MIRASNRRPRPGFTLLEILLASAIAVMLLGALYAAFDLTLRSTEIGRELVGEGDLSRAVFHRMNLDIVSTLGPMPPKSGGGLPPDLSSTSMTSGTPAASSSTTGSTTTSSSTTATSSSTSSTSSTEASSAAANSDTSTGETSTVAADVPFQAGVFGTEKQLTLFASRMPPGLVGREQFADSTQQQPADLVRITYYMSSNGQGLCRQIRPWVTADGVRNSSEPDRSTEAADIIADDVTDISFEYLDAGSWMGSWDGSQPKTDGKTPLGPPRAVRVILTIAINETATKQVEHVIPLRTAVGLYQPPVPEETETGGM